MTIQTRDFPERGLKQTVNALRGRLVEFGAVASQALNF